VSFVEVARLSAEHPHGDSRYTCWSHYGVRLAAANPFRCCRSKPIPLLKTTGRRRLIPNLEQVSCREPTVTPIKLGDLLSALSSLNEVPDCWSLSGVNFICLPRIGGWVASCSVCIIFVSLRERLRSPDTTLTSRFLDWLRGE